jgi:hypothetical protein
MDLQRSINKDLGFSLMSEINWWDSLPELEQDIETI